MHTLSELKTAFEAKQTSFNAVLSQVFTGASEYDWHRACSHMRGDDGKRNTDTSRDAALANDESIKAAWAAYIKALHAFYTARDGERGFLGGRGL